MRRGPATLGLALCLLGCDTAVVPVGPVHLAVVDGEPNQVIGCLNDSKTYLVIADAEFGTRAVLVLDEDTGAIADSSVPLYWPPGYTGSWAGFEVEVRDPAGKLVAVSGRRYRIMPSERGPRLVAGCVSPG